MEQTLRGHVRGLAVSPDGKRFYAGATGLGRQGDLRAYDAEDGKLLGTMKNDHRGIEGLAISPDGLTLATTSRDGSVRLWDATTYSQKNMFEARGAYSNSVAFLPDGRSLVAVFFRDATIRMFDAETMHQKYRIATGAGSFLFPAVSPDGSILATGAADSPRLQLWRSSDGSALASVPDTGGITTVISFAPDGGSIALGGLSGSVRSYRLNRDAE